MDSRQGQSNTERAVERRRRSRQRWIVALVLLSICSLSMIALDQVDSPVAQGANTTTSSTIAGPVLALTFPVQGRCSFIDTFGAPRSGGRSHEGVDLIAKAGQFVYAVAAGTLTKQYIDAPGSLSGNGWRLTAAGGTYYFYAHLSAFAAGLSVGSTVVPGQIIGYVGATGNAGTPHLHFEIHPGGGAAVNPTQSVRAVDGCAITTPPPVGTNPTIPGATDSGPTQPTLAKAVRIPATVVPATPTTAAPASTAPTTTPSSTGVRWSFVEPVVVFNGSGATVLVANTPRQIALAGFGTLASSTAAVMVRVSATAPSAGTVTVHPCGASGGATTSLTVEPGTMAIGTATVPVASARICVSSTNAASVKLTVIAQATSSGVGARPVLATRALDTRVSGRLTAGQRVTITPTALGVLPSAKAVSATITVLDPAAAGTLSIAACGGTELRAPFVNTALAAFSATVGVAASGVCISSTVATDVIVDITGGWDASAAGLAAVAPVRVLGTATAPVAIGAATTNVTVAGAGGLPPAITTASVQVTIVGAGSNSSVFVWPCDQPRPVAAVGVVAAGRSATFAVMTAVAAGQICIASNAPAAAFVDVVGAG